MHLNIAVECRYSNLVRTHCRGGIEFIAEAAGASSFGDAFDTARRHTTFFPHCVFSAMSSKNRKAPVCITWVQVGVIDPRPAVLKYAGVVNSFGGSDQRNCLGDNIERLERLFRLRVWLLKSTGKAGNWPNRAFIWAQQNAVAWNSLNCQLKDWFLRVSSCITERVSIAILSSSIPRESSNNKLTIPGICGSLDSFEIVETCEPIRAWGKGRVSK